MSAMLLRLRDAWLDADDSHDCQAVRCTEITENCICAKAARAALAALREPTEGMLEAGIAAMDIASHDDAALVWYRMLDAAAKEG